MCVTSNFLLGREGGFLLLSHFSLKRLIYAICFRSKVDSINNGCNHYCRFGDIDFFIFLTNTHWYFRHFVRVIFTNLWNSQFYTISINASFALKNIDVNDIFMGRLISSRVVWKQRSVVLRMRLEVNIYSIVFIFVFSLVFYLYMTWHLYFVATILLVNVRLVQTRRPDF
jgi:hypothetical protein